MEENPIEPGSVAAAWATFEKEMLNSLGDIPEELRAIVKENFYASQSAMLKMIETQFQHTKSPEGRARTLQDLRKALDQALDDSD